MNSGGNDLILIDKPRPHTTVIRLNRPERMNSMSFDLMVPATARSVSEDSTTRCVILTGEGRVLLGRRHEQRRGLHPTSTA
ncbi:MAG: hypothetical protein R2789_13265 [Microthrixaceae bacterium]